MKLDTLSVVVISRNEGAELRKTVAGLLMTALVVVEDVPSLVDFR